MKFRLPMAHHMAKEAYSEDRMKEYPWNRICAGAGLASARLVLAALLALAGVGRAQIITGTLTGSVVDPAEALIPGAAVKVEDLATGRTFTTETDSAGEFALTNLSNGFYRVTVEAAGFANCTIERIQIFVAQTSRLLVRMELARLNSQVVVTAKQLAVQTQTPELQQSVDRAQIINLPLPTRNPLDLVQVLPGVVLPTSASLGQGFIHGLRANSTHITQDGVNVRNTPNMNSSFFALSRPTVDTVGEFNVSSGGIGVDAGFGAAQISMVTQRGGNDFHGSLFWFQRTNFLNANTWFNNASGIPRPFELQQRIGASAGGPVYIPKLYDGRPRTWVFGAYEAYRESLSRSRTRTVLTPTARQGLFTWTPPGRSPQVINLLSIGTIGNTGATPVLNPDVMNFYNSLVPSENLTDTGCAGGDGVNIRCFAFNLPGSSIANRYTLRLDHQLSRSHSLEFVFNQYGHDWNPDFLNFVEPNFPGSPGGSQDALRQVLTWALHSAFGANRTNELRFGYFRNPGHFNLFEDYKATGGYQLKVGTVTDPVIAGSARPSSNMAPVQHVLENFAWSRRNHLFRIGGEYARIQSKNSSSSGLIPVVQLGANTANPNGITAAKFPGGITPGDLTRAGGIFNLVTGLLGSVGQTFNHSSPTSGFLPGVPATTNMIQQNFSGYFQDAWKLRPNLTLTLGLRYEYQGVFDESNGLMLAPQEGLAGLYGPAGTGNLFNPREPPAMTDTLLNFSGGHNGKPMYKRDLNNFAPYLGFAWDPLGNGKTAVRGSFAAHYVPDSTQLFEAGISFNAGLTTTVSNAVPTGVFSTQSNPTPAAPVAVFPVSQRANFIANPNSVLVYYDNNLRTPYVLEWTFGLQRELGRGITIEGRYVGNHAVKQFRAWSINELDVENNGLLQEFRNAQGNLAIGKTSFANQGKPGQVPLPIFDKLFAGLPAGFGYSNSGFITLLNQNQIGAMFSAIRTSPIYLANREANLPLNFFVANPYALLAVVVDNASWSYYHAFELEVKRRFGSGFSLGANYTFGKVLTDARFLSSALENQLYSSLRNTRLDKNRAAFDVPHSFGMNFSYALPVGRGQRFGGSVSGLAEKVIGGWNLQGLTRWSSGAPFTIVSNRVTTGSLAGTTAVLRNLTAKELKGQIGLFRHPEGVFWLNPDSGLITISGGTSRAVFCTPGQTTPCFDHPGANEDGNTPNLGFNSPRFFTQDLGIIKRTPLTAHNERLSFEIRLELFNAFNNANFTSPITAIDSSTFGRMTKTVDPVRDGGVTARVMQWAIRLNW